MQPARFWALLIPLILVGVPSGFPRHDGVVVEEIVPGTSVEMAGLRPGSLAEVGEEARTERSGPGLWPHPLGAPVDVDLSAPYFWAAFQLYGDWR